QRKDVGIGGAGRLGIEVFGEGQFLGVGRDGETAAAFEREGRNVAWVVRVQVTEGAAICGGAGVERNDEEVRAFFAGEAVPVAVEQLSEDLRLDFARRCGCVAILVALVAGGLIGCRDGRAIGIHRRGEYDGLAIGRPLGVVGFG